MSKKVILLLLALLAVVLSNNLRHLTDSETLFDDSNDEEDEDFDSLEESTQQLKYNLTELVAFRHDIHQHPEPGFHEFRTQRKIIRYLRKLGVHKNQIKKIAITGLQIDIPGKAKPQGEDRLIAFRSDIDALDIFEDNPTLPYRSVNSNAHACGHDGHITCALGFISKLMDDIHRIPSNKVIRMLFQPSEEGPIVGAPKMIADGCLDGVQEIYGWHNAAQAPVGYFGTTDGMLEGQTSYINLTFFGGGGHAADPTKQDAVQLGVNFINQLQNFTAQFVPHKILIKFPYFKAAERWNVVSPTVNLQGAFRTLEVGFDKVVEPLFFDFLNRFSNQTGFNYTCDWKFAYHATINDHNRTQDVVRVANQYFGPSHVLPGDTVYNSEDFSYYQLIVPGNYFYLGASKYPNDRYIHTPTYNFDDDLIPVASGFLYTLALDRLNVTLA
ncbi:peptidase M20D, amidohydrolase (macronuclear) [Tetrahymena thermophila SB210]|uniref:Peptidase M20D, amidohydrolase n=1 Tax=Tetrahymena thermophila (strain SB210) TaxID=312017 RepID=Q23FA9_TETTS|nr:peptidase M20D, amidohydrolase [Tetrahymena thermophila SB210]EAR95244.1 peptidase M20D, amidohydrolase [Tetrahymena thermophila SB210]|eukprot:XP_001015489.1 peptidase M20D, amidohydrolase [Tetrahymena thermophila SB210]